MRAKRLGFGFADLWQRFVVAGGGVGMGTGQPLLVAMSGATRIAAAGAESRVGAHWVEGALH